MENSRHKFRAWDKNKKWMVYDVQNAYDGMWSERNSDEINDHYDYVSNFKSFMDEEEFNFMQYTGLKDKNGVEIYEGDILYAVDIKNPYFWQQHGSGKCVIEWKDGSFVTRYKNQQYPDTMLESAECFNKFEIIGNIYENIGLLEEAE